MTNTRQVEMVYDLMPVQLKNWTQDFIDRLETIKSPLRPIGELKNLLQKSEGIYVPRTVLYVALRHRGFLLSDPNFYGGCLVNVSTKSTKAINRDLRVVDGWRFSSRGEDRNVPDLYAEWKRLSIAATGASYCQGFGLENCPCNLVQFPTNRIA